jgi:RES domain-containing protein
VTRTLHRSLTAYRIGDASGEFPIFSAEGASRVQGRWHEVGDRVIYASEHYSTAMLETLVRWNTEMPEDQHFIRIAIPAGTSYEVASAEHLPNWHMADGNQARGFGHRWYVEQRSAALLVPSVVARLERNVVLNASHAEFSRIEHELEQRVWWDERLFGSGSDTDVSGRQ